MKKKFGFGIACLICALVLLLASACTSTGEGTTVTPFMYTFDAANFEILGEVIFTGTERPGYIEFLRAARNLYPECDYVIDIMIDQRTWTRIERKSYFPLNLIFFFLRDEQSVESEVTWVMRGTAIRYK